MYKLSLKRQLIIVFVLLFLFPLVFSLCIMDDYAGRFAGDSIQRLNVQNMKHISASIDQVFRSVNDFSLYLLLEKNIRAYLSTPSGSPRETDLKVSAQEVLSILPISNTTIKAIALFGQQGQYLCTGINELGMSQAEKELADQNNGYYAWTVENAASQHPSIFFIRKLRIPTTLAPIGYLKIRLNLDELASLFAMPREAETCYFIMTENDQLVYASAQDEQMRQAASSLSFAKLSENLGASVKLPRSDYYVTPCQVDCTPWIVFSVSQNDYGMVLRGTLTSTFISYIAVCSVFCLLLAIVFTRMIVAPLRKLGVLMEHISQEDYSVRFHAKGNDEIAMLANQFDMMSEKLQTLYTKVYLSELKLKQSQLSALQAQINPHFLYNTLDTIYWMSEFHHTSDVSQMIASLSALFRICISNGDSDQVSLKTEIEHVKCYMYIQQIRYQDQLSFSIHSTVDEERTSVMKLVLQPLVENAVIHGIGVVGHGTVTVEITQQEGKLVYEVSDDACVANAEEINAYIQAKDPVAEGKGIALRNINDRIVLRYSKQYGVTCICDGKRTTFRVLLPLEEGKEEKLC